MSGNNQSLQIMNDYSVKFSLDKSGWLADKQSIHKPLSVAQHIVELLELPIQSPVQSDVCKLLLLSNQLSKTQRLFTYCHKWHRKAAKHQFNKLEPVNVQHFCFKKCLLYLLWICDEQASLLCLFACHIPVGVTWTDEIQTDSGDVCLHVWGSVQQTGSDNSDKLPRQHRLIWKHDNILLWSSECLLCAIWPSQYLTSEKAYNM